MLKGLRTCILMFVVLIRQPANHMPVVRILQPANYSVCSWGSQIQYSVEVSDMEDGESKFQEIQPAEVLIRLKYMGNQAEASAYLKQKKISDTAGLMNMMISNCFSCHGFKTKLAGPSFQDISKKYPNTSSTREQLENHIITGSTGIWGKEVMPTHPELNAAIAQKMVQWILTYANDPGSNYFVGLQGVLTLNKPKTNIQNGVFIVTAFYTDHGITDFPNRRITGFGHAVLKMK
jgi:cytochrome c